MADEFVTKEKALECFSTKTEEKSTQANGKKTVKKAKELLKGLKLKM